MDSVFQNRKVCFCCGSRKNIECHYIFDSFIAEKYGMKIYLCSSHHNRIHIDSKYDVQIKKMAQAYYESQIGTRKKFEKEFGKSWL